MPICFAICLLFLGAESLQVDIYLNLPNPSTTIGAMKGSAVNTLVGLFRESTNGLNPLMIDWNTSHSSNFGDADPDMTYALQDLQELAHEYCKLRIMPLHTQR